MHGRKDIFLEDIEYSDFQKEKETEADAFASAMLFDPAEEEEIIRGGDFSHDAIVGYAERFGTHPSIIVGRLQHKHIIGYWQDSDLLEKIELFRYSKEKE